MRSENGTKKSLFKSKDFIIKSFKLFWQCWST